MIIQRFNRVATSRGTTVDISWEELRKELLAHKIRGPKSVDYFTLDRPAQNAAKDGELFGPYELAAGSARANANVIAVNLFVIDVDHATKNDLLHTIEELKGIECVIYTTHSSQHNVTDSQWAIRVVAPLSRPLRVGEFAAVRRAFFLQTNIKHDSSTDDPARIYYFPTCPPDAPPEVEDLRGVFLDPDWFLGANAPAPAPLEPAPVEQTPITYDRGSLAERLSTLERPESRELARVILAGEPLAKVGAHDSTLNQATWILAATFGRSLEWQVAWDILRPSCLAMEWQQGIDHCEKEAKKKFDRALIAREKSDAKKKAELESLKARLGSSDDLAWQKKLLCRTDRDGVEHVLNNAANVSLILEHDKEWRGVIRFNVMSQNIEVHGAPIEYHAATFPTAVAIWFGRSQWRMNIAPKVAGDCFWEVACRQPYDPLQEYLEDLAWDGISRIDNFTTDYCKCETTEETHEVTRAMGAKWLISAVARGLKPGVKVDTLLLFQGAQGQGKSSMLRALGGEFFSESPIDVGSKDGQMAASRFWIVEFSELSAMKKADTETLKSFLSTCRDSFRVPYGRGIEEFDRRAVFAGSTNATEFLRDETGNRRFWCVKAGKIDLARVREDRDQIWAEAVYRFKAGESWVLSEEHERVAERVNASKCESQPASDQIVEWWFGLSPEARPQSFKVRDVMELAFGMDAKDIGREHGIKTRIGIALPKLGFARGQRYELGYLSTVYTATPSLMLAPQKKARELLPPTLTVVRSAGEFPQ